MGMFSNYQNISTVPPNNLTCSFPVNNSYTKLNPLQASKPYEEYNAKGELVGYFWRYGETLNLEFNIDGEIVVEATAIILTAKGEVPSDSQGNIMQRAYNITDERSWTCTSIVNEKRNWTEDKIFTYPEDGKSVYITAEKYLSDKNVNVTLYNFRMEPIYTHIVAGTSKVIVPITNELSAKMVKGVYYCSLTVFNDNINLPIFNSSDCLLLVK